MKKAIIFSALAAMVFVSCVKELEPAAPNAGSKTEFTLEGASSPLTKVSIGDPVNGICPVLWSADDKIGIFSLTEGAVMDNVPADLNPLSAGKNIGVFSVSGEFTLASGKNDLFIYFPYDAEVPHFDAAGNKAINICLPQSQYQKKPNDNTNLNRYAFGYAKSSIDASDPESKPSFTLTHATTYVKIKVSSSEFASYKLKSVVLCDKSATNPVALGGAVSVDLATGAATVTYPQPWVGVNIEEPQPLSSPQEVYLCVMPCDFTGKDTYVVVTMENDTQSVTIPVKVTGKKILANAINVIEVSNVKMADNTADWFDPVETRYIASNGWAYGPSNNYFFNPEQNADQVASVAPVNISFKAHGNFAGAKKPHHLTVMYGNHRDETRLSHILINGVGLASADELDKEGKPSTKTFPLNADYSADFKVARDYRHTSSIAKLFLYDENNTKIWSTILWISNFPIGEFEVEGYVVADRTIGQIGYGERIFQDVMGDTSLAEKDGKNTGQVYFQWGRPFALCWAALTRPSEGTKCTSLQYSAEHPDLQFVWGADKNPLPNAGRDWIVRLSPNHERDERYDDLWGNPNSGADAPKTKGHKSIFDPCPKGWMVACPEALFAIRDHVKNSDGTYNIIPLNGNKNTGFWEVCTSNGKMLYMPHEGLIWGETAGNSGTLNSRYCAAWSNAARFVCTEVKDEAGNVTGYDRDNAFNICWDAHNSAEKIEYKGDWCDRARTQPVRCMKDTENR